jgi:hypothetical protein
MASPGTVQTLAIVLALCRPNALKQLPTLQGTDLCYYLGTIQTIASVLLTTIRALCRPLLQSWPSVGPCDIMATRRIASTSWHNVLSLSLLWRIAGLSLPLF